MDRQDGEEQDREGQDRADREQLVEPGMTGRRVECAGRRHGPYDGRAVRVHQIRSVYVRTA